MQDATATVARKGLSLGDYFDPRLPAVLDGSSSARVNYETFVFAEPASRDAFLEDLVSSCGLLTDPVSKRRFRPQPDAPRFDFQGVIYLFPDAQARAMFLRDPEMYRLPGFTM